MTRQPGSRWFFRSIVLATIMLAAVPAVAQRNVKEPHLAYAYPAGCQRGETCEIVLGGQHLQSVTEANFTGGGIGVEIVSWYRPLTRGEYNKLRMNLTNTRQRLVGEGKKGLSDEEVAEAANITAEELLEMERYRQRDRDPKRQPNEQLEEELTIQVTATSNAKLGKHELRVLNETAISNPVWLHVGQWRETRETEPNDAIAEMTIDHLPTIVNGQILPGDRDMFSFTAKQGTRLVVAAAARDVIPYLADAVPGWFQAVLTLTDSMGKEVAYADAFHYRQDPVMFFDVPRDDRYTLEIRDSIYRGREDFVYRITLGEVPMVNNVFPLGARWNSTANIELNGWNLSQTSVDINTRSLRSYRPVRWFSVEQNDGVSVNFPLQIDRMPEVFDQEPNNRFSSAQEVKLRSIVNGRIDTPGDRDVIKINGQGRLVAEVFARRGGSPLDSMLTLYDAKGKELAFNDDHEDRSLGLMTHHADSHLVASIPASGCFLHIEDAQNNGGDAFVYRLYLRSPEPDFELRVTPASVMGRPGAVTPITVHALRRDNFDSEIEVALVDPPTGFHLSGGVIPANEDQVEMTLTIPTDAPSDPVTLDMNGRARRGRGLSTWVTRPVVPAENMMQAFIWYHLVPVEDWRVVIGGKPAPRIPFEVADKSPRVTLPRTGEITLPLRVANRKLNPEEIGVESIHPQGISVELVADRMGQLALKLVTDSAGLERGSQNNLILQVYRNMEVKPTEANPNPAPRRYVYGLLPAIPYRIAGR